MPAIKRMLVPTDFSPASDIALTYAVDLAAREDSAIQLLHVVDDASVAPAYADAFHGEVIGLRAQIVEDASVKLEEIAQRYSDADVNITTEVLTGRPAPTIAQRATTLGSDLVVMGTHGRSGFAHLVLGSVAERVLRIAPCPVLAVRDTSRVADALAMEAAIRRDAVFHTA